MEKNRIPWIDTCKGLGIILVVLGHVVQGYWGTTTSHMLDAIHAIIYSFHMYLFFILSGVTFSLAYLGSDGIKKCKVVCQLKNILYIFTFFSITQWCLKTAFSSFVNSEYGISDLLLFSVKPMPPYWYLWVLAIYYMVVLIVKKELINRNTTVAIGFIISITSSFICTGFSETPKNVLFFTMAFILGLNFNMLVKLISWNYIPIVSSVIITLFCVFQICKPIELEDTPILGVLFGVIISLSVMSIIFRGGGYSTKVYC